jgi:RNA polymerase sigma-70 factor, ECF subfamily
MKTLDEVANALQALYPRARALTKNRHDAEDLVHDTFVRAARYVETFVETTALGAWLNTMMYRLFLTSRRSGAGRQGKYTYARREVSIEDIRDFDIPVESTAEAEWDAARLLALADELPPADKQTIELVLDGASYKQMQERMNCTRDAVKWRVGRARNHLRQKLAA